MIFSARKKIEDNKAILEKLIKLDLELPEAVEKAEQFYESKEVKIGRERAKAESKKLETDIYDAYEVAFKYCKGSKIPLGESRRVFTDTKFKFEGKEEIDPEALDRKLKDVIDKSAGESYIAEKVEKKDEMFEEDDIPE